MENKTQLIAQLQEQFDQWEKVIGTLSEAQIEIPLTPSTFSIKDTLAHLRAWQQLSIARLEAAQADRAPVFPDWVAGEDPDADDADPFNARIYAATHQLPWAIVHQNWRAGFLKLLKVAAEISEEDFNTEGKYSWLNGYALSAILQGTYEHHVEHLDSLRDWRRQQEATSSD